MNGLKRQMEITASPIVVYIDDYDKVFKKRIRGMEEDSSVVNGQYGTLG